MYLKPLLDLAEAMLLFYLAKRMNKLAITSYCIIRKGEVITKDKRLEVPFDNKFFKEVFTTLNSSYAKFYKMDRLCKLAYLASEYLLASDHHKKYQPEEVAMVFSNSSSSIDSDIKHQATIANRNKYFPEPATFVYTLPNIMLGEISIRHNLKGENMFFVSEKFDPEIMVDYISILLGNSRHKTCIAGWVEYTTTELSAALFFVEPVLESNGTHVFSVENIQKIMEL
jgi:hypothetical protein